MKNNKGFTLIELLAVILILGIIALIAVPVVNDVLQDSRVGAWKSTANNMASQAETYLQMRTIKDSPYITNFKTGATSNGKYAILEGKNISFVEQASAYDEDADELNDLMVAALLIKGDLPKIDQIDVFTVDEDGAVLKFGTPNAYCATVEGNLPDKITNSQYEDIDEDNTDVDFKLVSGSSVKCAGIEKE